MQLKTALGIAAILGMQGEHQHALKHLEQFLPLARMINRDTPLYYDYLNSFAVELNDAERTEEARNVISLVLSTPYAKHYSNWIDTGKEIYRKSYRSSMVSAPKVRFEKPDKEPEPESETQTGSVIAFPALKEAPQPEKPERLSPQEVAELTPSDMRELILAAIKTGAIQESEYIKMMGMVGLLKSGPAAKILDLEDEQTLNDIAVIWAHQVEPEEMAAVLSAIRDCEDRIRQRNILDRMIRIAFEETQLCGLIETEWRLEVERRLPKK